jgi:hypothetical protein
MDATTRTPKLDATTPLGTRTARAWHRALPPYARNEIDTSLLREVDRLPERVRGEVLTNWSRASAAGLYDAQLLRTIVEVVAGEPAHPLPVGA